MKSATPDEIRSAILLSFVGCFMVYWETKAAGVMLAPLLMLALYLSIPPSNE